MKLMNRNGEIVTEEIKFVKTGDFIQFNVCRECHTPMTDHQKYYSHGLCKKCGYTSKVTVCDTRTVIYRKLYIFIPRWFEFWKAPEICIEAKNDFSHEVISKMMIKSKETF